IGNLPNDNSEVKFRKKFLIDLGLFMSCGGIFWGILALSLSLPMQSLLPFGYIVLTIINFTAFYYYKNFKVAEFVQTLISILLPFFQQWAMGGFSASGAVMLWSLIGIVASLSHGNARSSIQWLVFYMALTLFSALIDSSLIENRPVVPEWFPIFLFGFNIGMISLPIFGVAWFLLKKVQKTNQELLLKYEAEEKLKEEAERTAKFRSQFLANMSHEIRTPMNGVVGMLDILSRDTDLDAQQKEYVGVIKRSSSDLMMILNDVLDLSKLESGQMKIRKAEVVFEQIIEKVLGLFAAKATEKGLTLRAEFVDRIPYKIEGDGLRLTQILSNLVGNAIKFTEKGEVLIRISVQSSGNPIQIKAEVIDSGMGVSPENQKVLFNAFQQLDQSSTKSIGGTGLGLAICKNLVHRMNGDIGIVSETGEGSNFWFTFEAAVLEEHAKEQPVKQVKRKPDIPQTDAVFGLKVMVVDDDEVNLMVAERILLHLGCTATTVDSGKEALVEFEADEYDLILMDIQMPEMDGVETTKRLKRSQQTVPPIIGLSANAMEGDAEKYMAQGLDDYLHKPVTLEDLGAKLAEWFPVKEKESVS
ncbi:MAG: response regulator, partial [Bacteroidota bacterium]